MAEIVQITIGNVLRPNGSGSTTVVDNLLSSSATSALSANQGRVLKAEIDSIVQGGDAVTLQGQNGAYYLDRANHTGAQGAGTITEDATHRFVTDAEKTTWDNKANVNSPAFTGTPTAPTVTAGDNSQNLATTAFVMANSVRMEVVAALPAVPDENTIYIIN